MSVNKYKKHVMVYAEDEATKQLAESFLNDDGFDLRRVTLQKCQGWKDAVERAKRDGQLDKGERRAVVLIDLDGASTRVTDIKNAVPADLQERIFIIGWTGCIEQLKINANCRGIGFQKLGEQLAADFRGSCAGIWTNQAFVQMHEPDTKTGASECQRLRQHVLPLITAH